MTTRRKLIAAGIITGLLTALLIWAATWGADAGPVTPTTTSALTPVTTTTEAPTPTTEPPAEVGWHWPGCTEPPCPPPLTDGQYQALLDYLGATASDPVLAELGIDCSGINCACTCGLLCPAKCDTVLTDCGKTHDTPLECCVQECNDTLHCGTARKNNIACEAACREVPHDSSKWHDYCPHDDADCEGRDDSR